MEEFAPSELKEQMAEIKYNPNKDQRPVDKFAPINKECIRLPESVKVKFVSTEEDVKELKCLVGAPFIGMDSEWKPQLTSFDSAFRVALF